MNKNKELRKSLFYLLVLSIFLFVCLFLTSYIEIKEYQATNDQLISSLLEKVKEKYPEVTEEEMLDLLNAEEVKENDFLKQYGIDLDKEALSLKNQQRLEKMLPISLFFFAIYLIGIFLIVFFYNKSETKKIKQMTNYLSKINKKEYDMDMLSNSEDEFSLLKNEIYKTAITLNEQSLQSSKDKQVLKRSLSDISHQIKTPLTSITIRIDNLLEDPDMDKKIKNEFLKDIHRKVNNINFLVQSLLKLSRFDVHAIVFHNQEVYIQKILQDAIKNVSMLCELKEVKICIKNKTKDKLFCDSKWQTEAITNILKNAVEHSHKKDKIIISYTANKIYSKIQIQDQGKGIPPEDLPHIFERFYKGKNASSDSVGIGLALAKTIIEKNAGSISVDSKLGKGTVFTIKYFKI